VPDQELIDQCRRLYDQHKDTLDLVFRYGRVDTFESAANLFFKNHPELHCFLIRSGAAAFLPTTVLEAIPPMDGMNWWGQSRPFLFWFNFRLENKLGLVVEVGPFAGEKYQRGPLAQELLDYFKNKNKIYPKYTRVYSEYKTLIEDQTGDAEEIQSIMETLYNNLSGKHVTAVSDIVRRFFS